MDWNELIDENGCARIPEGIENIPTNVFCQNRRLTSVIIPEGVSEIEGGAFYGCERLEKISLPKSLKIIGMRAFIFCRALEEVSLPDSLEYIGQEAFCECQSLTRIRIPEGITEIKWGTFIKCWNLSDVYLPHSLMAIGGMAFSNCNLKEITIPENVSNIPLNNVNPFSSNKDIKFRIASKNICFKVECGCLLTADGSTLIAGSRKSTIPNGVKIIGYGAFQGIPIKSIDFPDSIIEIGRGAFAFSTLVEAKLPKHLRKIGGGAFFSCEQLKYVYIPKTLKSLSYDLFCFDFALRTLEVHPNNAKFISEGGNVLSKDGKKLILSPEGSVLPDGIQELCDDCFYTRKELREIILPNSVEIIGRHGVKYLGKELYFPDGVKTIGNHAFSYSRKLQTIRLPETLQSIGLEAFQCCRHLRKIVFPSSVQSLDRDSFSGCCSLSDITILNEQMGIIDRALHGCPKLCHIRLMSKDPNVSAKLLNAILNLDDIHDEQITLHVPAEAVKAFRSYKFSKKLKKVIALRKAANNENIGLQHS